MLFVAISLTGILSLSSCITAYDSHWPEGKSSGNGDNLKIIDYYIIDNVIRENFLFEMCVPP